MQLASSIAFSASGLAMHASPISITTVTESVSVVRRRAGIRQSELCQVVDLPGQVRVQS